ncbi:MAG: ATP-dependent RecD-like DNA helicase [Bacilli bacterium]|nr:ATP-dependent RecD-like DNA helicase [Bacilli bacterium]
MNELVLNLIIKQNNQIEKHLEKLKNENEDINLVCVDIIGKLRTLLEHIGVYYYNVTNNLESVMNKDLLRKVTEFMKKHRKDISFVCDLHLYLQASSSHYVIDEISAPRLLWKYIPYLYDIKKWFKNRFDVELLSNLNNFNYLNSDYLSFYYEEINNAVKKYPSNDVESKERYYIYKSVPIIVKDGVLYETTVGTASDFSSKFNEFIVFSKFRIDSKYAIKLSLIDEKIKVNSLSIPIKIATNYLVSVRPCEFDNLGKLVGLTVDVKSMFNEYKNLMGYLTDVSVGLHEIILENSIQYKTVKAIVLKNTRESIIFKVLDKVREAIVGHYHGYNVLKYLLVTMNNKVIKDQYSDEPNSHGLNIKPQPFDNLPFAMSLIGHNTQLLYLLEVFEPNGHEDEFFYRRIANRTNQEGILYHSFKDLNLEKENALSLTNSINSKLNWKPESQIVNSGDLFYIRQHESSTEFIFDKLFDLKGKFFPNYRTVVQNKLNSTAYKIDSPEKNALILSLFEKSAGVCIFGPAGTGKSTMAKHISAIFQNSTKKYISNTNPAVMNMFRKVGGNRKDFMTVKKFIKRPEKCDLLFVDECSMVSNADFKKVLELGEFKYLILLGDIYQIQSIEFGSWFKFAKYLLGDFNKELNELHRTTKEDLRAFWDIVRKKEPYIDEIISSYSYNRELIDASLFEKNDDQIILCLSYGGLYGINNLNAIMQERNENQAFKIGNTTYKINDPILFLENNKFSSILYNNLKGKIINVYERESTIVFDLNVESNISILDLGGFSEEIDILENKEDSTTTIRLIVEKEFDSDNDEQVSKLVPFQLAYAISIHKAQGLEYKSVKIVIDENCDEMVSHDIFYTAITRATEKLSIYWTSKTQKRVLSNIIEEGNGFKDVNIFASKHGYKVIK